jgi:hypothetical protein
MGFPSPRLAISHRYLSKWSQPIRASTLTPPAEASAAGANGPQTPHRRRCAADETAELPTTVPN